MRLMASDRLELTARLSSLERRALRLWEVVCEGTPANQSESRSEAPPVLVGGAGEGEVCTR